MRRGRGADAGFVVRCPGPLQEQPIVTSKSPLGVILLLEIRRFPYTFPEFLYR